MDRRTYCKRSLAYVSGAVGLSSLERSGTGGDSRGPVGEREERPSRSDIDAVTTRGHFGVNWFLQTYLEDDHTKYDFDTRGSIPGYHTDSSPEEICVFVHGWLQSWEDVATRFPKQRAALRKAGFDGPVIVFDWKADSPPIGWWVAAEYARRNAHKLGEFLRAYRERNPETVIRVVGFSLGGLVVVPVGRSLARRGWGKTIDSLALLGAAVDDEAIAEGGQYHRGIETIYGEVDNYYMRGDRTLSYLYKGAEFDGSLGAEGIEGSPPANYEEHDVDYVGGHGDYWKYDRGCVRAVVDEWRDRRTSTGRKTDTGSTETDARTLRGTLSNRGQTVHRVDVPWSVPEGLVVELSGERSADLDCYLTLDGRTPAHEDHDRRSTGRGPDERIVLESSAVHPGVTLGILVRAYRGGGEYSLRIAAAGGPGHRHA